MIGQLKDSIPDEASKQWEKYLHLFKRIEVPAKTILLKEGDIARKAYFIEKGCARLWFNNNGKDVTFQFFFEDEGVSSIESFKTRQPSLFSIETIEPCIMHAISDKDFNMILAEAPALNNYIQETIFHRLVYYQKLFLSRIKDNPQKRYQELLKEQPHILLRVPQHYIASYLGITSVSLSRIRNKS